MRMTPLDVHSHRFGRRLSGYDPEEVDAFLRMIAEDYESLLRENQNLRDQLRRVESRVEELGTNEQLLKETLVSAQSMSDDLRQAALKESEVMLCAAEVKAEKVLDAAHRRSARLAEDIREMRGLRSRLATALRATIETHLGLIESLEMEPEQDPALEGRVTSAAPTGAATTPGPSASQAGSGGGP
jgi:cell division initiation protein